MSDSIFVAGVFILIILFAGNPDFSDAIRGFMACQ
jgi:hypothetical protein